MSDFGDTSGVSSSAGYGYQKLLAAYYLIVKGVREIEYEADGEDISLINEDRNRKSIEYIQAKDKSTGEFSLSKYRNEVFPQMWTAFTKALEKNEEKSIYCTLITSVALSLDLKTFMDLCEKLRDRGYSIDSFHSNPTVKRQFDAMKTDRDEKILQRFLWGAKVIPSFTYEHIEHLIISYLNGCNVREPRKKLALVKDYISEKRQGVITRNRIIDIVESELIPIKETSSSTYNEDEVKRTLAILNTTKSKYSPVGEYPDIDAIYRDMTQTVERAAEGLLSYLDASDNTVTSTAYIAEEIREIIVADKDKAKEEAQICAELENQLWTHRKKYEQRTNSMMQTARDFGIGI